MIELDDFTHDVCNDRQSDAITKAAGFQTLRFQPKHKPSVTELADFCAKLLPTLKP